VLIRESELILGRLPCNIILPRKLPQGANAYPTKALSITIFTKLVPSIEFIAP
jgi:hypothetical protein